MRRLRAHHVLPWLVAAGLFVGCSARTAALQTPASSPQRSQDPGITQQAADAQVERQKATDATWQAASAGVMQIQKTTYVSRAGGLTIPVFVFKPLQTRGPKAHAAIVWVHPDIRGHVYEYYIPYVRDAIAKGYIVIAPEYRGSVGYGKAFYDAIDYGGTEVDDVLSAVDFIKASVPEVDPARIGIIGWSHGGMITLLSITKEPTTFKSAVAMVPVTNLFQRLARKGVEQYHRSIDPFNRFGGLPAEKPDVYKARSAIYQIDKLQIPLLVHVTKNDADVNIEECMQLIDALRARKPELSETKVYDDPLGGHLFDRQFDRNDTKTYTPLNTPEQVDSWARVWTFFNWHLKGTEVARR